MVRDTGVDRFEMRDEKNYIFLVPVKFRWKTLWRYAPYFFTCPLPRDIEYWKSTAQYRMCPRLCSLVFSVSWVTLDIFTRSESVIHNIIILRYSSWRRFLIIIQLLYHICAFRPVASTVHVSREISFFKWFPTKTFVLVKMIAPAQKWRS